MESLDINTKNNARKAIIMEIRKAMNTTDLFDEPITKRRRSDEAIDLSFKTSDSTSDSGNPPSSGDESRKYKFYI